MKRVLVTGAGGFLGAHTLAALAARGWSDVHAVSRTPGRSSGATRVTWHACDLFDPAAVGALMRSLKPTHVLHLAWCTTPGEFRTSSENLRWVAAGITLIEEFARAGGRRFVGAGTCAEYEWKEGAYAEESTPLRPQTPYGAAKHALESLVNGFGGQLGISTAWGRIFFPYGPHEHPERLTAYVIRSLLAGEPALCTSGEQRRDFIYASDVADAFTVLLDSGLPGAVNIGSGEPVQVRSVVTEIGAQLGREELIRLGARAHVAGEPELMVADLRLLREGLGWHAKVNLREGIAKSIEYWRNDAAVRHATDARAMR